MPPATAAEPTRKARREIRCMCPISLLRHLSSGRVYRRADAWIGAATAKIAGHHLIDLLVGWLGDMLKKRNGLHDLAGLTVAALRHLMRDPGLDNRVAVLVGQPFHRDDRLARDLADTRLTGTDRLSI